MSMPTSASITARLARQLVILAALPLMASGCSRPQTAQARTGDARPKEIKVERVRKDAVRRSVDVVGTLAAVDQVTISSEADGKVRRILADLGDRVTAGQVLIELDSEKQQYTYEQQQAALARALAQYGATDPKQLPDIEKTPEAQRRQRRPGPGHAGVRSRQRAVQAHADLAAGARRRPRDAAGGSVRGTTRRCRARKISAPASRRRKRR